MKSLTSKVVVAVALAAGFIATHQAVHAAGWPSTPGTICPPYSGSTSYVVPSYTTPAYTTPVSTTPVYYNSGGYYGGTSQPLYNGGYGSTPMGDTILPGGCYSGNCYPTTLPSNGSYYPDPYAVPANPYNVNYRPLPGSSPAVDPWYGQPSYGGYGGYGYDLNLDHRDDYRYRTHVPAVRETWPVDYTRPAYDNYNVNVWPANGYVSPRPEPLPAYAPDYRYQNPSYRGSGGGTPFYP